MRTKEKIDKNETKTELRQFKLNECENKNRIGTILFVMSLSYLEKKQHFPLLIKTVLCCFS